MNAEEYCRTKAAPSGSNFYYSTLFQSPNSKQALLTLFAFHYEIHDAVFTTSDPGVTQIKLQWWRDELQRLSKHHLNHPLSRQLQALMEEFNINASSLLLHMNAMESLVISPTGASIDEWLQNYYEGLGEFWHCTGKIVDCQQTDSLLNHTQSGSLVMIFDILQNLRSLLAKGYNPLPDELMEKYGIYNLDMASTPDSGIPKKLFSEIIEHLISALDNCFKNVPDNDRRKLLFSLIMNRLTMACCKEIRADGYKLLEHKISLTPIRKLWIAWKTKLVI